MNQFTSQHKILNRFVNYYVNNPFNTFKIIEIKTITCIIKFEKDVKGKRYAKNNIYEF